MGKAGPRRTELSMMGDATANPLTNPAAYAAMMEAKQRQADGEAMGDGSATPGQPLPDHFNRLQIRQPKMTFNWVAPGSEQGGYRSMRLDNPLLEASHVAAMLDNSPPTPGGAAAGAGAVLNANRSPNRIIYNFGEGTQGAAFKVNRASLQPAYKSPQPTFSAAGVRVMARRGAYDDLSGPQNAAFLATQGNDISPTPHVATAAAFGMPGLDTGAQDPGVSYAMAPIPLAALRPNPMAALNRASPAAAGSPMSNTLVNRLSMQMPRANVMSVIASPQSGPRASIRASARIAMHMGAPGTIHMGGSPAGSMIGGSGGSVVGSPAEFQQQQRMSLRAPAVSLASPGDMQRFSRMQ